MACLKTGVVANVVVPHPEYVQFATFYGFRPDFCEAADPNPGDVEEPGGLWCSATSLCLPTGRRGLISRSHARTRLVRRGEWAHA